MKNNSIGKFFFYAIFYAGLIALSFLVACTPQNGMEPETDTINSKVVMRSCNVNGNTWEILPEYPSAEEIARVMALIGSNEAVEAEFPAGCTEYIIQHVGGAHHMYSYEDFNHAMHTNIDGTSSQELFSIKEQDGNWVGVSNFNGGKCDNSATHNAAMMDNGFLAARTMNEYASNDIKTWKIFLIDGQYYLGIDFTLKKDDGQIDGDGIYDDWVVKIIPINGAPTDPTDPTNPEDPTDPTDPVDPTDPTDPIINGKGHVEFDVHQQEHQNWKEIKTSIHLRDTVDFTILIPIPEEYQAEADDFDLRLGEKYEYLAHSITLVDKTYDIVFTVCHKEAGIEIFVEGSKCAEALRLARALYGDGLTFEVHTYVKNEATDEMVWNWLKMTEKPTASPETTLLGQITSAFYPEEGIRF